MNPMFVNVIHRVDPAPVRQEALRFQQDEAHRHGFKTTLLLTYGALLDETAVAYAREQRERFGDELGIHLHELMCPDYRARFGTDEKAFWLLSTSAKRGVLDFMIERFTQAFGAPPLSVGSYILDAATLGHLRAAHPSVKVAITNCFEEGIRMYQGNNQTWYLFSDGGPWGPYYPSRESHLCPAHGEQDSVGILGLPHLNRDMVLSLTSRDDLFASHPVNLVRAMANQSDRCDYLLHFIDQWIEQAKYNGSSYYSLFVSTPWVAPGHPFVKDHRQARRLYAESLAYLKDREDAGLARCVTMGAYADWHRANVKPGTGEVNLWNDILCGSGRQMFWHVDSHQRVAIDLNAGGAICDLRPYGGRLDRNMGPDTPSLWNGNYPFLISSGLRGGYQSGPMHTCELHHDGRSVLVSEARTHGRVVRDERGIATLEIEPVTLDVGGLQVTVRSSYRFCGDGRIEIQRKVTELSDTSARVEVRELHRGCWGTTEYPEDLSQLVLHAASTDEGSAAQKLGYAYQSRKLEVASPRLVAAELPPVGCRVTLEPLGPCDRGVAVEGHMFRPFYTLILSRTLSAGQSLQSRLRLSSLA